MPALGGGQVSLPTVCRRYLNWKVFLEAIAQEAIGEFAITLGDTESAGEDLFRTLGQVAADYVIVLKRHVQRHRRDDHHPWPA
jgi:hypothetical protein